MPQLRMLMTLYVKTESVSSISKRDLGDSDVAEREEEEEGEEEGMAGHRTVPQPGKVNHSWSGASGETGELHLLWEIITGEQIR